MKNFKELMDIYNGNYTETYCKEHSLFVSYDSEGKAEHITRQLIDLHEDVISTDLNFILGGFQTINADSENAVERLQEILDDNDWDTLKRTFITQGLILGTSALKVGKDEKGDVRIGLVSLMADKLDPKIINGEVVQWELSSGGIKEVFSSEFYERDGQRTPNKYGVPWIFVVANRPNIEGEWQGDSEWEAMLPLINEINSIQSRIARIEDIYAKPKILVTGSDKASFSKDDNVWFIRDPQGSIGILEYHGDIMNTMQMRSDRLIDTLKNKCPELILNDLGQVSGYSLRLKLQRLEKKINQLKDRYFRAIEQMFSLVYAMDSESSEQIEFSYVSEMAIPSDTQTLLTELMTLNSLGIVSRQTMAEELGYNYEDEQKKVEKEERYYEPRSGDEANAASGSNASEEIYS